MCSFLKYSRKRKNIAGREGRREGGVDHWSTFCCHCPLVFYFVFKPKVTSCSSARLEKYSSSWYSCIYSSSLKLVSFLCLYAHFTDHSLFVNVCSFHWPFPICRQAAAAALVSLLLFPPGGATVGEPLPTWLSFAIPTWKQVFKACLGYIMSLCLKKKNYHQ